MTIVDDPSVPATSTPDKDLVTNMLAEFHGKNVRKTLPPTNKEPPGQVEDETHPLADKTPDKQTQVDHEPPPLPDKPPQDEAPTLPDKPTQVDKATPTLPDKPTQVDEATPPASDSDSSDDEEITTRPWQNKVDGLDEMPSFDDSDTEPDAAATKKTTKKQTTKRVHKKKAPPPKPIAKEGVNKLKAMQEKFNAKKAATARTTRSTVKKAAAVAAADDVEEEEKEEEKEKEAEDPLWRDDVEEEEKEEDEDEEIVEERPNKKRKKPAETKNNKKRKKSTKKKRNASPAKAPRECWPERKVGVRPETLNQMMDITTRGKVKALKKPIEILQVATLPYARSDEFAEQTNPTITGAIKEQRMWPWNIHGAFHYAEQRPNASGNTTEPRFLDVPELHLWVGSGTKQVKRFNKCWPGSSQQK